MVALLVLAVYALSLLVKVGGQVATTSTFQAQARQNALLALNVALGRLQAAAGPDARATATAGILASTLPANSHWTGVWTAGVASPVWLVSGSTQPASYSPSIQWLPPVSSGSPWRLRTSNLNDVVLVGEGTIPTGTNSAQNSYTAGDGIVVPREEIVSTDTMTGQRTTHIAYWVGDEGVKATANFQETADQLDYDGSSAFVASSGGPVTGQGRRLRQMLLPRPRIEEIATNLDPTNSSTRSNLQKVISFGQIPYAASGTVQLASIFHDLTPESLGVFSNPLGGGLKLDLSAPGVASSLLGSTAATWMAIRPSVLSDTSASHRLAGPSAGMTVGPLITELGIRFCFYRSGTATAASGSLSVACQMQVEFWNPYTTTLEGDGIKNLRITVSGLPQNLTVTTGSGSTFTGVNLQAAFDQMQFQLPATTTWEPGTVSVFYGGGSWSGTSTTTAGLTYDFLQNIPSTTVAANRWVQVDSLPSENSTTLIVHLNYAGEDIATFHPETIFGPITAARNAAWAGQTTWLFGYGYAVRDSFSFWADGSASAALDPRQSNLASSFTESSTSIWQSSPLQNTGLTIARSASGGSTFYASASAPVYPIFELPQQEVMSVGALQHVPGTLPNQIGNPWGGSLNAIFDRGFFSALQRNDSSWNAPPLPIAPNPYLKIYIGSAAPSRSALLDGTTAASHLFMRGAFNVNSTSAKAWRTLLGGAIIPAGYTLSSAAGSLTNAFFRHSQSAQDNATAASKPTGAATARKQGVRDLSESQVSALANAMALLNQGRSGPYLSLEDFVNSGALATALDPNSSIANEASGDATTRQGINNGSTLVRGMPSYLSQADILTSIAPCILARSDTFRIRAYGDVSNPVDSTKTEATAYCEAIVQRTPEQIDSTLGRRFVVTYFRWLGPDDI
ncbi:MAG TPA: hypothetical protein VHE13_14390 [Opitutus sp.]|nr:hypothetical protein [Opitutus sp.]